MRGLPWVSRQALTFGPHMYPNAPGLWQKHGNSDVVGVSDDAPGETYWKVANGIRLTGMPSFKDTLSDTQMWQVSLLLANSNKPLPPAALAIVRGEQTAAPPAPPVAQTQLRRERQVATRVKIELETKGKLDP